jgi:8-oxo-dGTP pyrophosphatase MutT (NUDIX family)
METVADSSYGVIPVCKFANTWKVFLIHQYGSAGDVYWTFPKGHAEGSESPEEAAIRELKEETGIDQVRLQTGKVYPQTYSFMSKNTMVEKYVGYYLGIVENDRFSIQEQEVQEAGWFTFEEGRTLLTFDHARALLTEVEADLQVLGF